MKSLKGKPVFQAMDEWSEAHVKSLKQGGFIPTLGIIRVGRREDDLSYEKSLLRKCDKLGIEHAVFEFDSKVPNEEFLEGVEKINNNPSIHGILMFRPLPDHLDFGAVLKRFRPDKDIDGMLPENLGKVLAGEPNRFGPCTAEAVVEILKFYAVPIEGANVAIINHSNVVGKPLAMMLTNAGATITVCHHMTRDLPEVLRTKDIVVSAIGKARFFGPELLGEDQILVDVGINVDDEGMLCGDIDFDRMIDISQAVTPVPGGVGGVTTSLLLRNVVKACYKQIEQSENELEVS